MTVPMLRRLLPSPCQYGALGRCGAPSVTKRMRPNGAETWDVCDYHAAILTRMRASVAAHRPLLDRLSGP